MRIFIGFKIASSPQLKALKNDIDKSYKSPIKWIKESNLHLTLVFIGVVPSSDLTSLKESLYQLASKYKSINLNISGIGIFKKRRKKSILWLKISPNRKLTTLQLHILKAVKSVYPEFINDFKEYTPHITLARFNANQFIDIETKITEFNIKDKQVMSEIQIIESVSKPGGVEYKVLESFNLSEE